MNAIIMLSGLTVVTSQILGGKKARLGMLSKKQKAETKPVEVKSIEPKPMETKEKLTSANSLSP